MRLAPRPAFLAGREGLLADLDARLAPGPGRAGPRVAVLCGLGGAGKTSVAVEYAHRHLAEVGVCWQFAAEDPAVLAAEFAVLAAQLGARDLADARDPVASVHAVLARAEAGWLLVFDNVPDLASVEAFLPPGGAGAGAGHDAEPALAARAGRCTSRSWTRGGGRFLTARTGDADRAAARELAASWAGCRWRWSRRPRTCRRPAPPWPGTCRCSGPGRRDLLARGEAAGHREHTAATLGLALSRLEQDAPAAAGLLRLLAFLAPEPVPLGLLLAGQGRGGAAGSGGGRGGRPLLGDPVAAGDAVAALRRYSLVAPAGDGLVLVHRLVQAVTRAQLTADEAGQWQQAAAALVEAAVPADPQLPAAWPACAVLLPHARAVLDLTSGGIWQIAQYLGYSGSYPAARDLFALIADAHRDSEDYGPEHPDTLAARANLADWTGRGGGRGRGPRPVRRPAAHPRAGPGPEHPDTLTARANLAYWTGEAGDAAGARDQYAALLPIRERVLGPEHPDTLTARTNLARWTGEAGDAAGARDQFAALLPVRERVSGPEHPDTLTARSNLARWTGEAGDAAGARDQFAALLPIRERVLGPRAPRHPDHPPQPRPLDRGGGGRGRGPRPVRRPAAHPRAGPGPRAPRHPDHPRQPRLLDRAGGGCGLTVITPRSQTPPATA